MRRSAGARRKGALSPLPPHGPLQHASPRCLVQRYLEGRGMACAASLCSAKAGTAVHVLVTLPPVRQTSKPELSDTCAMRQGLSDTFRRQPRQFSTGAVGCRL